ncbi:MAG TPA: DUF1365 domain-containing protein [Rhizomicrobium sp.]|nr:DUF1365 domain-containing protein [Rhizomicrobium sp.]
MNAIYNGIVTHTRVSPARHSFRYRVFSLLLDLDEIDAFARRSRLFAHNGRGIISFHDSDHGDGRPLREWVQAMLSRAGIDADGRIELLCYPRLWGFVFNPLSVWFCRRADESLAAIIYEVHNTFGERHTYVLPAPANDGAIDQACCKDFYVSPFLSMDSAYRFHIEPPGDSVLIAIRESECGNPVLHAAFSGKRQTLSDRNLALAVLRHPLMTIKIVAAIYFEALRLWLKRVPSHAHIKRPTPAGLRERHG